MRSADLPTKQTLMCRRPTVPQPEGPGACHAVRRSRRELVGNFGLHTNFTASSRHVAQATWPCATSGSAAAWEPDSRNRRRDRRRLAQRDPHQSLRLCRQPRRMQVLTRSLALRHRGNGQRLCPRTTSYVDAFSMAPTSAAATGGVRCMRSGQKLHAHAGRRRPVTHELHAVDAQADC